MIEHLASVLDRAVVLASLYVDDLQDNLSRGVCKDHRTFTNGICLYRLTSGEPMELPASDGLQLMREAMGSPARSVKQDTVRA